MSESEAPTRFLAPSEPDSETSKNQELSAPELISASSEFASAWTDPPPPSADGDPLLNTTLSGAYVITRVIGEGGMGRVYEAQHTRIKKKRYAIKVLHPEFTRDPDILSRFQREAEAAASLSHPSAVGVYDVALTPQGWPYMVCEFLNGIDLSQMLKTRGPLSAITARHVALQVCDALIEAHANGVVHRDLKPQNVFLLGDLDGSMAERPTAKVLDFGLSRFLESSEGELTRTGVIMGTPSYMAPEQARGERVDHRVDVYGVGALLYASLTGKAPFRGETAQAIILAVMNTEPLRPSKLNPNIPAAMELLIQRAMAREVAERHPDMLALRNELEQINAGTEIAELRGGPSDELHKARAAQPTLYGDAPASRTQLLMLGAALLVVGSLVVSTAVCGAVLAKYTHWPLTRNETILSVLLVAGTLLTPTLLWLRWFRRKVWGNTARVVEVLTKLKQSLSVGLITYGVVALSAMFFDIVVAEMLPHSAFPTAIQRTWPGLGLLLVLPASVLSGATLLQYMLFSQGGWAAPSHSGLGARSRRFLAGPVLLVSAYAVALGLFGAGFWWRLHPHTESAASRIAAASPVDSPPPDGQRTPTPVNTTPPLNGAPAARAAETQAVQAVQADDAVSLAQTGEVTAAISQGLEEGLLPLLKRYPRDPKVLRAVAVAEASSSASLGPSMTHLKALFIADPKAAEDNELKHIIMQTSRTGASEGAYELMANYMGSDGPDLLYKLALSKPEQRDAAQRYLAKPQVRAKFSDALAVAYDLNFAQSCSTRVGMLDRARRFGDERSVRILAALASSTSKGCGYKKRKPCKAPCPVQAEAFLKTVESITTRLRQAPSQ